MGLFLAIGVFAAQPAEGQVDVTVVADVQTTAPATVVLTASVATDDVVIAYDWGTLASADRCRQPTCAIDVPLTSCHVVRAEVTTLRGDTGVGAATFCVDDEDGSPPRVEIRVVEDQGAFDVNIALDGGGTDVPAIARMWVDDQPPIGLFEVVTIARDGACHAIDALVVDRRGRVGFDRRTLCTSRDAPRAWVSSDLLCPPVGSTQTTCVEVDHPLGLSVTTSTTSAFEANTCTTNVAPSSLTRRVFSATDERGRSVFASTFLCGSAAGASRSLFFLPPQSRVRAVRGDVRRLDIAALGGTAPFDIEVDAPGVLDVSWDADSISVTIQPMTVGTSTINVRVVDAEGLTAVTSMPLEVSPPTPVGSSDAQSSACATTTSSDAAVWLLLLGWIALLGRRSVR